MIFSKIFSIFPLLILTLYQTNFIWKKAPRFNEKDTLVSGSYSTLRIFMILFMYYFFYLLFIIQIFFDLFKIGSGIFQTVLTFIGYIIFLLGFSISQDAIKRLGYAWTGMALYRIKKGQSLVTEGVYNWVRHPIYLSIILQAVGYELILGSWIFIMVFVFFTTIFIFQIKNEESLLESYHQSRYFKYKKKIRALFPFIY